MMFQVLWFDGNAFLQGVVELDPWAREETICGGGTQICFHNYNGFNVGINERLGENGLKLTFHSLVWIV